jgi:hemoglobin-like flavoprotein
MNETDSELFNDSLERCSAQPDFLGRFYRLFIASSDVVAKKFEHTDLKKQARMLRTSLYIMIEGSGEPGRETQLERLARRHSRGDLDIKPELYDLWLEKLLQAVGETDPQFDAPTEAAWRRMLQPGIDIMKSGY